MKRVAIGSDHAGFEAKELLRVWLVERGHPVDDVGTHGTHSVDYPDFAFEVASRVAGGEADFGVLVCGTGIGMSIAANKVAGVRAAVCTNSYSARLARAHNRANVLCLGARVCGSGHLEDILRSFLETPFEGGRHLGRIDKIHRREADGGGR